MYGCFVEVYKMQCAKKYLVRKRSKWRNRVVMLLSENLGVGGS